MNCPTCGCCAKENIANFKKFYFCSECRKEVSESLIDVSQDCDDFRLEDLTPEEREEYDLWLGDLASDDSPDPDYNMDGCD